VVDYSWNGQTGTQPPIESIEYQVATTGDYGFFIEKYEATESPTFVTVHGYSYSIGQHTQHQIPIS
jgi:hypothetical protein